MPRFIAIAGNVLGLASMMFGLAMFRAFGASTFLQLSACVGIAAFAFLVWDAWRQE